MGTPFRIIKNAGPPEPSGGRPRRWKHIPLRDLATDDALELDMTPEQLSRDMKSLQSYVYRQGKRMGKKFSVRQASATEHDELNHVYIYRTK